MTITNSSFRLTGRLALGRLVLWHVTFGIVKHLRPLPWLAKWAWRSPIWYGDRGGPDASAARKILVGRVLRAAQLAGVRDRDCLQRSLVLYRELSRMGANPTLVVGFRRSGDALLGHVWVLSEGQIVAESARDLAAFTPVCQFGRDGRLSPALAGEHCPA
jgi:hypothetical protein